MTRHQHYVAIVGCALIRRSRGGGHPLVAGVRCKHPVDLLAQLPVNEDFGARRAVVASMTRHQHYVAIVGCAPSVVPAAPDTPPSRACAVSTPSTTPRPAPQGGERGFRARRRSSPHDPASALRCDRRMRAHPSFPRRRTPPRSRACAVSTPSTSSPRLPKAASEYLGARRAVRRLDDPASALRCDRRMRAHPSFPRRRTPPRRGRAP